MSLILKNENFPPSLILKNENFPPSLILTKGCVSLKKVLLKIDGMTCSACSSGLEKYLNKQEGVVSASVNLVMNNASIEYDDSKLELKDLEDFVSEAGFESLGIDNFEKEEKKIYTQ